MLRMPGESRSASASGPSLLHLGGTSYDRYTIPVACVRTWLHCIYELCSVRKNSTHIEAGKHPVHTQFFLLERAYGTRNKSMVQIACGEKMFEKQLEGTFQQEVIYVC
jgi:hypothetical protein